MISAERSVRPARQRIALSGVAAVVALGSVVGLAQTSLFGGESDAAAAVKRSKQTGFIAPSNVKTKTPKLQKSVQRSLAGRIPAALRVPARSVASLGSASLGSSGTSSVNAGSLAVPAPAAVVKFPSRVYAPSFRQTFPSRVYAPDQSQAGGTDVPAVLALVDPNSEVDNGSVSSNGSGPTPTNDPSVPTNPAVPFVPTTPVSPTPPVATPATPAPTVPVSVAPTTAVPSTVAPTTIPLTTVAPTTAAPTTAAPTTAAPTTAAPRVIVPAGELRPDNASREVIEQAFVSAINELRASKGLRRLSVDPELVADARVWSAKMSGDGYISHDLGLGTSYAGPWVTLGENVGAGPEFGGLQAAFVASAKHYENLIRPNYTGIGIGVVFDGATIFVTERFVAAP